MLELMGNEVQKKRKKKKKRWFLSVLSSSLPLLLTGVSESSLPLRRDQSNSSVLSLRPSPLLGEVFAGNVYKTLT